MIVIVSRKKYIIGAGNDSVATKSQMDKISMSQLWQGLREILVRLESWVVFRRTVKKNETRNPRLSMSPKLMSIVRTYNDGFFFNYHSWRNNVVIAFGTLSPFLIQLHIVSGVVYSSVKM